MKHNIAEEHSKIGKVSINQPHLSVVSEPIRQTTIRRQVSCRASLHSGNKVSLTLKPATQNTGILFVRSDIEGSP